MEIDIELVEQIKTFREKLTKSVELVRDMCLEDEHSMEMLRGFANNRSLPLEFLLEKGVFFLGTQVVDYFEKKVGAKAFKVWGALTEIHQGKYKGQFINMMEERIVIPLYTYGGQVCGLCGYDGDSDAKYIYCKTLYFNRRAYLYGEENLLTSDKPLLVGEGLVDAMWLEYIGRDFGYHGLSTCGVKLNNIKTLKLRVARKGIWYFPDRDAPGMEFRSKLLRILDNIKTFYVGLGTKDPCAYFCKLIEDGEENSLAEFLRAYESGELTEVEMSKEILI